MSLILDSEQLFKVRLFDSLEFCGGNYEYIFTPHYCHYDLIIREPKNWIQIYIEHKERDIKYLENITKNGLMINVCKLHFYKKYLSGSFVIIATTINGQIYWVQYDVSFNNLNVEERNQDVVYIPFKLFSNNVELLAEKIVIYFNQ
tara:strand:- start:331 stop:768 length:438 start_codon:yes stop_codon:yes gene_type:complete